MRLSLIPSLHDGEIGYARGSALLEKLHERRTKQPELDIRVPSVLDAVTHWFVLRAQGDKLDDNNDYRKTQVVHFDLEPKAVNGSLFYIPFSYVGDGGKSYLSEQVADYDVYARLAVG